MEKNSMNSQPLFSVLIANYNNGKYLMEAVESVRQQTYSNWEIVLVDDGSTDNSNDLYSELQKDERIHIYHNGENKGCGFTKHRCVELANGEYCGFLDPDDVLLSNALQVSARALLSQPTAALSFSRFYYCDEMLNIKDKSRVLQLLPSETYFEHKDFQPEVFAAFRRNVYNQTRGIDCTLQAAVDQDLYFKLEEKGCIVFLDDFTYKYRRHVGGISYGQNSNWAWYWNMIVWHNTCLRRGLSVRNYSYDNFNRFLYKVRDEIRYEKEFEVKDTWSYRIGRAILKPIKLICGKWYQS